MKSVCSGFFRELLLFSAIVLSGVALPMSSMTECIEQKAQRESFVVIRNIGIKMCQVRCIKTGGCLRFDFDIETLICRLKVSDSKGMVKMEGFKARLETHSIVIPISCSTTSCSLGARCLGSRYGKPVCVKGGRTFYPSRSQQQKSDKKSRYPDNLLHKACRDGDVSQVQTIMSKGQVDIDSREGEYGRTPVMLAARGGHRILFEFLIEKGCNMSLLDNKDNNILHMACYGGQIAIVKRVLSLDIVDINSRGHYGRTCVMVAAYRGKMDLLKYLVKQGGDMSLLDKTCDSILHIACRGGHVEMVKYIISQDIVDINSKGRDGRTVGMVAAQFGYRNIFDLCACAGCNLLAADAVGNNILHVAILGGQRGMVKHVLTERLVNINSRGMNAKTPIMVAAIEGQREVFDLVMSKGGDASLVDKNGDSILHWVCRGGQVEMVKYVISLNFTDINGRGQFGKTPMMVAAVEGHREVFDFILSKGGNATLVDTYGDNILHWVCRGGHIGMVKYIILQNFTDINSRGYYGKTPMMVAAIEGHRKVFDLVMSKGGDASLVDNNGDNILHWVCSGGHVDMVKYIISQNFTDINSRGQFGKTPMMMAAAQGHRRVFDLIMSKGGDASLVDKNDDNILHWVCRGGHVEMVRYIISLNVVDINSRGYYRRTPMMVAAAKGHRQVLDLVMSKGGDASLVDAYGDNILHLASWQGQAMMMKHILSKTIVDVKAKDKYGNTAAMIAKKTHIQMSLYR